MVLQPKTNIAVQLQNNSFGHTTRKINLEIRNGDKKF